MRCDLRELKLVALLIDGAHFAEHVVPAWSVSTSMAPNIPLELRQGATENAAACKALLGDLIERGLESHRAILVVLNGAKSLRRAVLDTFGERALVQRCQAHKKRNVTDAPPERMRAAVRTAMNQAHAGRVLKRARGCWRIWRI
ncbi:MAG: transposase [Candidatus Binataceae bacterium]